MADHLRAAPAARRWGTMDALLFMAKWPEPGRAKTRLCPPLSGEEAAALARAFLLDTLAEAALADADRWLAFAPAGAADDFARMVGPMAGLIAAEGPDLGASLSRAQAAAFAAGYRRVALVASDVPHLDARRYGEAFDALERADVALGPSGDGGYYLLASARPTPALFERVAWSTDAVFEQTRARAAAAGLTVACLASCNDVDTAADLPRLADALRDGGRGARTRALLAHLAAGRPRPERCA